MLTGPIATSLDVTDLRRVFDALRHQVVGLATESDMSAMKRVGVHHMTGGRNNPIFGCTIDGQRVCIKLHKTDGRQRDRREWEALSVLAASHPAVSPLPIGYEPEAQPAMAIELLPGTGLGHHHLTADQVRALVAVNREVHAVTPEHVGPAELLPARLTDDGMLTQVQSFFTGAIDLRTSLRDEMYARWSAWTTGTDPKVLAEPIQPILGQGEPNLTNCLWDGERFRLIDWEYAGWSNQPYELALLVEHVQSRETPDDTWQSFLDLSGLTASGHRRTLAARRLVAWFWLVTFWPTGQDDDERFEAQARRVSQVLNEPER